MHKVLCGTSSGRLALSHISAHSRKLSPQHGIPSCSQQLSPTGGLMICRIDSGSGKTLVYTSLALSSPPSTYTAPSTCMPVPVWRRKSAVSDAQESVPVCLGLNHASTSHTFTLPCAMCDAQCSMETVPTRGSVHTVAAHV